MLDRFNQRDLFVRCLELSRRTVRNWGDYHRKKLTDLSGHPEKLEGIERNIHRALPGSDACNLREVLLNAPALPNLKNDYAFIQTSPNATIDNIEDYFPIEQWVDSYAHNNMEKLCLLSARTCQSRQRRSCISAGTRHGA